MLTVKAAFADAEPDAEPEKVLGFLNDRLADGVSKAGLPEGADIPAVSVVYFNILRGELVSYGDCAYSVDGKVYNDRKKADIKCAEKRAEILKRALKSGMTEDYLRKNDIGRAAILGDLIEQAEKFANACGENGYACINGGTVMSGLIRSVKLDSGAEVVLCSDGYPVIEGTLAKSEMTLAALLKKDILCINELRGTKCVAYGNYSFDDRTYVRFTV